MTLSKIYESLNKKININKFDEKQLAIMILFEKNEFNVKLIDNPNLSSQMMLEIFKGLKDRVRVELYKDILNLSYMKIIRMGLLQGLNFNNIELNTEKHNSVDRLLFLSELEGNHEDEFLKKYGKKDFSVYKLKLLYYLYKENKVPTQHLLNETDPKYTELLYKLIEKLNKKEETKQYISNLFENGYSLYAIREINNALDEDVFNPILLNPGFDSLQLRQIRLGLAHGIDVTAYSDVLIDSKDMKYKRIDLEQKYFEENHEKLKFDKFKKAYNLLKNEEDFLTYD